MGDLGSWYGQVVDVWLDDRVRVAEVCRVVEYNETIVAGSWGLSSRWIQLDDRCG